MMRIFFAIALFVFASTSIAVRYQKNELYRMYFSSSAKTKLVGEAVLSCPSYSNNSSGWNQIDGYATAYYTEHVGEQCATGGVTGPHCPADSNPVDCTN